MCELFGYFGEGERDITSHLGEFFSHSVEHPQGWGLAAANHSRVNVEKEPLRAIDSAYLKSRLASGVKTSIAIAHIRLATAGATSYGNCHPFTATDATGRTWTLAHNGTILAAAELEHFRGEQSGSTDSERILLYLVSKIDEATAAAGHALTAEERFRALDAAIAALCVSNNKVNLLVYDGEQLYAHCNFASSLHVCRDEHGVFFSTHALSRGTWTQLPLNTLVAYAPGNLTRVGRKRGCESFQTAATIEAWQRANAAGKQGTAHIA